MPGPELEVHPDDLAQIADVLTSAGGALFGHASDLKAAPDAGRSSDEIAGALTVLATTVAGLGDHLGSLADNTGAVSRMITGTDRDVGRRFGSGQEHPGP